MNVLNGSRNGKACNVEIMKSLVENFYSNNVVFSYCGYMEDSVLSQILQITKTKPETNFESQTTIQRMLNATSECGKKIDKHNFYPDDAYLKSHKDLHRQNRAAQGIKTMTASGSGLIELVIKANEYAFAFMAEDYHHQFNINYRICCNA
jgi:hypothetical protein